MLEQTKQGLVNMGTTKPIEYHCKRCHNNIETKLRNRLGHRMPTVCGRAGCGATRPHVLPEVCFKSSFDPLNTVIPQSGRRPFEKKDGTFCESCFFEWALTIARMDNIEAGNLWEKRPNKELETSHQETEVLEEKTKTKKKPLKAAN